MKRAVTLTRWISALLLVFWLGLVILCICISVYTGSAMRRQAEEASADLLQVYLEKLDSNVEGIDRFLSQIPSSNYSISTLVRTEDATEHYLAKQDANRLLRNTAFIYNTFNGIFIYTHGTVEDTFLCQLRDETGMIQQTDIRHAVIDRQNTQGNGGWQVLWCENRVYLLRMIWNGDICCGAWLDIQSVIAPLTQHQTGDSEFILVMDRDGNVLSRDAAGASDKLAAYENGEMVRLDGQRYLKIGCAAENLPVELVALIPEKEFAGEVRVTQTVIILLFSVMLMLFPALWYLMNREISRPVKALTQAMSIAGQGDLTVQVSSNSRFTEFQTIAESLNHMTAHIRQLQKDVYERQLREQHTKLQYLQMQIRPHFFLNALNIIYSFSLTRRNDLIEQLILCLSKYFRYIFRCESEYVPLEVELEHIKNYMDIQRLRDHMSVSYAQEVDEVLLDALIPPLTIQPFVENSIKYGCTGSDNEIFLTAECRVVDGEQMLCITIRDNGRGYPEEILSRFDRGQPLDEDISRKIGLVNVRQRLQLTYGDRAKVHLGNLPDGGAHSEILVPLVWTEEEVET